MGLSRMPHNYCPTYPQLLPNIPTTTAPHAPQLLPLIPHNCCPSCPTIAAKQRCTRGLGSRSFQAIIGSLSTSELPINSLGAGLLPLHTPTYIHTYLPSYLPTYIHIFLRLPIYTDTYLHLPTYLPDFYASIAIYCADIIHILRFLLIALEHV